MPADTTSAFAMPLRNGALMDAEKVEQISLDNLHGEYANICRRRDLLP